MTLSPCIPSRTKKHAHHSCHILARRILSHNIKIKVRVLAWECNRAWSWESNNNWENFQSTHPTSSLVASIPFNLILFTQAIEYNNAREVPVLICIPGEQNRNWWWQKNSIQKKKKASMATLGVEFKGIWTLSSTLQTLMFFYYGDVLIWVLSDHLTVEFLFYHLDSYSCTQLWNEICWHQHISFHNYVSLHVALFIPWSCFHT